MDKRVNPSRRRRSYVTQNKKHAPRTSEEGGGEQSSQWEAWPGNAVGGGKTEIGRDNRLHAQFKESATGQGGMLARSRLREQLAGKDPRERQHYQKAVVGLSTPFPQLTLRPSWDCTTLHDTGQMKLGESTGLSFLLATTSFPC